MQAGAPSMAGPRSDFHAPQQLDEVLAGELHVRSLRQHRLRAP
jgi:hypothetical protein